MFNHFCKKQLWEVSKKLVDVAQGREKADTVIKNCNLVNVCTHEIQKNIDVAIAEGRIAMVGNCDHCIGENTIVFDAANKYLAPAFMDGHIHIESSMLTAGEYAKAVIPHGTSAIFMDPHEIYNVLGYRGAKYMLEDAKRSYLKTYLTAPSCVPAVPGFEDTGSSVGPEDINKMMKLDECVALGEMMNFPGIIFSDERTHDIVGETLKADKIVTGHYSIPETDKGLNAYVAAGIRNCHESTRGEDSLAKMRLGMYALFREGSAWHDLQECAKAITEHKVDSRFACMVSDDAHPHTLIEKGHLDHIIRRAISYGIDPITAIQMVTINIAQCYHLDNEIGSITPSKCADMVLLDDIYTCKVLEVWIDGEHVASEGEMKKQIGEYSYPYDAIHSIHLTEREEKDFDIKHDGNKVKVRVIEVIPAKTSTKETFDELEIKDGKIQLDQNKDILKAFVFERHNNTNKSGFGFIKGFGIKEGALAQTVTHDAHNLIVVGSNNSDMKIAANELIKCGGGMVAVKNGKILGKVELPIAGIMSDKPIEEMDVLVHNLELAWQELGCLLPSPFMTMSIIPLACLPELRLTNRGLVDCRSFRFVSPFVE
ncbi:MAG: adenine deaminase [Clostridia bacterium]|nr:adenine deaminase [Clostridia bacterium]